MSEAASTDESLIVVGPIIVPGVGRLDTGEAVPEAVKESQRQYLVTYGHARTESELIAEADQADEISTELRECSTEGAEQPPAKDPKPTQKKRPKKKSPTKALQTVSE
ncbi:MAG: hypothetical protein ABJZ55_16090 [Fuerstiella sp.]